MKLHQIIAVLNEWAPPELQESYDNAKLITGDSNWEISKAIATLDCTEEVVDEAIEKGCNLIIAHHPIVFSGLKSLTGKSYIERTVIKAIKYDIAIFAMHTNLDHVSTGVNYKFGQKLGLENLKVLSPKTGILNKLYTYVPIAEAEKVRTALFEAGAGNIGKYEECSFNAEGNGTFKAKPGAQPFVGEIGKQQIESEIKLEVLFESHLKGKILNALNTAHPYEEVAYEIVKLENQHQEIGSGMIGQILTSMSEDQFLKHVAKMMKCSVIRHTKKLGKEIKTVAICGGAGQFLLRSAISSKADVFITGDFKYHEFFDAENNIIIMDIGHFESEQFTAELIIEYLQEKFPTFAVLLSGGKNESGTLFHFIKSMATTAKKSGAEGTTVEQKLRALYRLQLIDSAIDKIRQIRGELPLEVEDLQDEIEGLETRMNNLQTELESLESKVSERKNAILDSTEMIKKYQEQQKNVRNNREFDSLSKEIEYQTLEIQLSEKRMKEFSTQVIQKKEIVTEVENVFNERKKDLDHKKKELDGIVKETEKEEKALAAASTEAADKIEDRLLNAYKRIRTSVKNGLAVVAVERGSSGGSFIKIPPQRQLDIAARKKIITDEHSGRILVDEDLAAEETESLRELTQKAVMA